MAACVQSPTTGARGEIGQIIIGLSQSAPPPRESACGAFNETQGLIEQMDWEGNHLLNAANNGDSEPAVRLIALLAPFATMQSTQSQQKEICRGHQLGCSKH